MELFDPQLRATKSGQSLWLHNVGRQSLLNGSLRSLIRDYSITGVSLYPNTICELLNHSDTYDVDMVRLLKQGIYGDALATELIMEDARFAADQLRNIYERTNGVDGWVTLPVWPLATENSSELATVAKKMFANARRPNILLSVPSCKDMHQSISAMVHSGVPILIDSVFTCEHFDQVCQSYTTGTERRVSQGLAPSPIFVAVNIFTLLQNHKSLKLENKALESTIPIAKEIYEYVRKRNNSQQFERYFQHGGRPIRVIWQGHTENNFSEIIKEAMRTLTYPLTVALLTEQCMKNYLSSKRNLYQIKTGNQDVVQQRIATLSHTGESLLKSGINQQVKDWIYLLEAIAKKSAELSK